MKRKSLSTKIAAGIGAGVLSLGLWGCDEPDTLGEKVEEGMEDAADKVGDTMDDIGDNIEDAADDVKDEVEDIEPPTNG